MTEIVKYICDECGEEFTDEQTCREHEHMERLKNLNVQGHLFLFDCNFKPIDYTSPYPNWWLSEVYYISADTDEAVQWFNTIAFDHATMQISGGPGLYFWDNDEEDWINLASILEKYNKRLAQFVEAIKHESESK